MRRVLAALSEDRTPDLHVHIPRIIGQAWGWRRRVVNGEFSTIHELAEVVGPPERHASRQLRLSDLEPEVLECPRCGREATAVSLY